MRIQNITIPKTLSRGEELVVVRRRDFAMFQKWREEVRDVLVKIRQGRKEYQKGKTVVTHSPRVFR